MPEIRTKVLFLITKGNFGGAQRYVFDLATRLPLETYNPIVAFGEGKALGEMLEHEGIRTISIPELQRDISFFREFKAFRILYKLIREEKPDILHINSSKAGFIGALAGRMSRTPRIIFTAHNWAFNYDINIFSKEAYRIAHWFTLLLSHTTIAVSQKTANDAAHFPFVKNKIKVVRNGIPLIQFENRQSVRTLLAPRIHQAVWIGTISELHKNKGIDFALRAFANLAAKYSHIAFVIIGAGEERTNLEALAEKLGISEKVHFLGRIPNAASMVKAFDIFTLTSRTEALPYTILEAGLAETAVVASKVGGIPEIIADKKSGLLVEAGNINEIEDALADLIEHPAKREKLGKELARTVHKKFSVEKMVNETEKVYEGKV